ncbi:FkbM family methyltransferase [Candidatus Woesearchaeota archaeon]|nr:FkbM family methyltransferase [Candidatus Woesearchaeota archaeon]
MIFSIESIVLKLEKSKLVNWLFSKADGFLPSKRYTIIIQGMIFEARSLDRYFALLLWKYSLWEGFEQEVIRRIVKPGMFVADIGANIGLYTISCAKFAGPTGKVYSFEPSPREFIVLESTVKQNNLKNVSLYKFALGSKTSHGQLLLNTVNRGDNRITKHSSHANVPVKICSLDIVLFRNKRLDVVKIDVQGYECEVLRGMKKLIKTNNTMIIIAECSKELLAAAGASVEEFLSIIHLYNFELYIIDGQKRRVRFATDKEIIAESLTGRHINVLLANRNSRTLLREHLPFLIL